MRSFNNMVNKKVVMKRTVIIISLLMCIGFVSADDSLEHTEVSDPPITYTDDDFTTNEDWEDRFRGGIYPESRFETSDGSVYSTGEATEFWLSEDIEHPEATNDLYFVDFDVRISDVPDHYSGNDFNIRLYVYDEDGETTSIDIADVSDYDSTNDRIRVREDLRDHMDESDISDSMYIVLRDSYQSVEEEPDAPLEVDSINFRRPDTTYRDYFPDQQFTTQWFTDGDGVFLWEDEGVVGNYSLEIQTNEEFYAWSKSRATTSLPYSYWTVYVKPSDEYRNAEFTYQIYDEDETTREAEVSYDGSDWRLYFGDSSVGGLDENEWNEVNIIYYNPDLIGDEDGIFTVRVQGNHINSYQGYEDFDPDETRFELSTTDGEETRMQIDAVTYDTVQDIDDPVDAPIEEGLQDRDEIVSDGLIDDVVRAIANFMGMGVSATQLLLGTLISVIVGLALGFNSSIRSTEMALTGFAGTFLTLTFIGLIPLRYLVALSLVMFPLGYHFWKSSKAGTVVNV